MKNWPPLFYLYRKGGTSLAPLLERRLSRKHAEEGGPMARLEERFGRPTLTRPNGKLIWIHAVSVGEALSILALSKSLAKNAEILLTTTSVTSAELIADRLPQRVRHQFAPTDLAHWIAAFLDHWSPDLAVFTESEVWPVTLDALSRRKIPVAVVNGRMSERSFHNWQKWAPAVARAALGRVSMFLCQDEASSQRLRNLGARRKAIDIVGTLKVAAERLPVDPGQIETVRAWIDKRPVWLAASTHTGEEEIVLNAHRAVMEAEPESILVLAPRHPKRANEIAKLIEANGMTYARRSSGELPGASTSVYLADTIGEMGLWFSTCVPVFLGGSLVPDIGGHNPMEAAQFGCALLAGRHVENAAELYATLLDEEAVLHVNGVELSHAILERLFRERSIPRSAMDGAKLVDHVTGTLLSLL